MRSSRPQVRSTGEKNHRAGASRGVTPHLVFAISPAPAENAIGGHSLATSIATVRSSPRRASRLRHRVLKEEILAFATEGLAQRVESTEHPR